MPIRGRTCLFAARVFLAALLGLGSIGSDAQVPAATAARHPAPLNTGARAKAAPVQHAPNSTTATVWTVNSTADTTGTCPSASNCTLRQAISVANSGDSIVFSSPLFDARQTISLTAALPNIAKSLTITGPGPNRLGVRRLGGGNYRIFTIVGAVTVNISGMGISSGNSDYGGAINNGGNLTVSECSITGNVASINGGAIENLGTLTIERTTLMSNFASDGGALYVQAPGTATLDNCTIAANVASVGTGAIATVNSGGAASTVTLTNCTIVDNTGPMAGGIAVDGSGGTATVNLKNTIVANNSLNLVAQGANAHLVSQGNNLANDDGGGFLIATGDLTSIDPQLLPIGRYGGKMMTVLPQRTSPAIDAGNNTGAPATDQRGVPRPKGSTVDIGAVEVNPLVVNDASDPGDGVCDGTCTLRDAISTANGDGATPDDIYFNSLFDAPQTVNLTAALPDLDTDITINGPGADLLTLRRDTGGAYRILSVGAAATVHVYGMTVANGSTDNYAGILNQGALHIVASAVTGSTASGTGGGVSSIGAGALLFDRVTVSGNTAASAAGVFVQNGVASLRNCTIAGNTASTLAGGILIQGTGGTSPSIVLIDCTVAKNTGPGAGGIYVQDQGGPAAAQFLNTILAGNGGNVAVEGANATIFSQGYNLVDDDFGGITPGVNDQTNINPRLTTFGNYGGPLQTFYPKPGSTAIDAGLFTSFAATDERGVARPQGAAPDIGAVEDDGTLISQDGFDGI
jgi:CSLREA domain-containing protein